MRDYRACTTPNAASQRGVPQPDVNTSTLSEETLSDAHVDALYAGVFKAPKKKKQQGAHGRQGAQGSNADGGANDKVHLRDEVGAPEAPQETRLVCEEVAAAPATLQETCPACEEVAAAGSWDDEEAQATAHALLRDRPSDAGRHSRLLGLDATMEAAADINGVDSFPVGPAKYAWTRAEKLDRLLAWSRDRAYTAPYTWDDSAR